jgi:hypothetical protein
MQKGGPMMWLILACSVLAGAVFLERITYFHRATIRVGEFLRGLSRLIEAQRFADALHECASVRAPVARVIHAAILRHDAPRVELKDIVQEAGQLEVPRLERRLSMLAAKPLGTNRVHQPDGSDRRDLPGLALHGCRSGGRYSGCGLLRLPQFAGELFGPRHGTGRN